MAKFIEHHELFDGVNTLPEDVGHSTVSIYNNIISTEEIKLWIRSNISGAWSCWDFNNRNGQYGRSYCFANNEDKVKFILRWL